MKNTKGFKAFDKDMSCRGFKFEVGKTYTHDGDIKPCASGFHFCESPLDVFEYYDLPGMKFAEITAEGEVKRDGTKSVTGKITIGAEMNLPQFMRKGIDHIWSEIKKKDITKTHKDSSHASTTGYKAHASTTGEQAHASTTGNYAHASTTGEQAIACSLGYDSIAKAALGKWMVLTEYDENYKVKEVKAVKVDGKEIKADTWYRLKKGKFVKAE